MLSTRFQNQFNYIVVVSFIGRGNRKNQEKTSDLLQVKTKTYSICIWNIKYNFLKNLVQLNWFIQLNLS